MVGGASWSAYAGVGTVGDTHYRYFLNAAAARAELDFRRRKQSPGVVFLCTWRVCRGARVSGTAAVRGSRCGCSRRRKSASQGWRQGEHWFFPERRGGGGGELEKAAQPRKRVRKEEARRVCRFCGCGGEGWERSLSLQRGGRSFWEMWEKGLRFRAGEGRSRDTSARHGWGRWRTASK